MPTAVAWRTAVALGDDCDARPYCVDKLLKLAAKGQVEIGRKTLIVVDEAGMLSTRQAHHILQLSERHGAKVVFAGDTRQQQPVEAGPGLRLIRDVAGSVRVDRIRRQKADLEDVLVHVHGETPEAARFQTGLTGPNERDAILADYEAMADKPAFTPWQVSASEALRGRGCGVRNRGVAPARAVPSLSRRGEDSNPSGRELDTACAGGTGGLDSGFRAHARRRRERSPGSCGSASWLGSPTSSARSSR